VFLFTDIVASTRRWEHDAAAMSVALARHDELARSAIDESGGSLLKHTGDGVVAVFEVASDALRAAVAMQRSLPDEVRVRAALHIGPAEQRDGDYFGTTLNRAARIMALAHGGQVLISQRVAAAVGSDLPPAVSLLDVGEQLLKDFEHPERLFQVIGDGLSSEPLAGATDATEALGSRSSFVGRETEIAELDRLLENERLVTLTGVGGSGKTRLALEVGRQAASRFDGGIFLVELASLGDPQDLPRSVAGAVGMPVVAASVARDLAIFLRTRECLLVLDNCEHLLDACADLVDELLSRCPKLSILATSREALAVYGERTWRVPSLSLPDDDDPMQCESVKLFVARSLTARADLVPDDHLGAIIEICRRLDGLPLAIELAAARTSHLAPEQIASMLDDRFRLLTGGTRRARQRQQTLQAAMDWSHDLLSGTEQRLLRRLSVFSGGSSLEAAVEVCAENADAVRVIDDLGSLVDKSLLIADESTSGAMRYRMLETVRLYGQDRLVEAGEAEERRDRHRDWMLAWLLEVSDARRPHNFTESAERIEVELENLRSALEWSRDQHRNDLVAILVSRSFNMWYLGLRSDEGRQWLEPAGEVADRSLSVSERVDWRVALAFFAQETMDGAAMLQWADEAIALDPNGTESAYTAIAWATRAQVALFFDPARAVELADTGYQWVRDHDSRDAVRFLSLFRGVARCADGQFESARELLEELVDDPDTDTFTLNFASLALVAALHLLGADDDASQRLAVLVESLPARPGRHIDTTAHALRAVVEASRGDADTARGALDAAIRCVRRRYEHIPSAWGLPITAAGLILAVEGRDQEALSMLVGVGAHGRLWHARTEPLFIVHQRYARFLAERLGPAACASAWKAGLDLSVAEIQQAAEDLAAERGA
jgi:predicted ATPase